MSRVIGSVGHRVQYVRIYGDEGGVSRFEDVDLPLLTREGPPPAPPLDMSEPLPAQAVQFGHMPQGWHDVKHPPPARLLFTILSGTLDVTAGGVTRRFVAGDVILAEDTSGDGHSAYVVDEVVWSAVHV